MEEAEAHAEMALRSNKAAMDLQEKFLTKKRRRIELLQSQSKDVALSKLSVGQFGALIAQGTITTASVENAVTANIPD